MTASSPSWWQRHSGALFAGGFGFVFALAGALMLLLGVPATRAHAQRVRELSAVTAGNRGGFAPGTPVLLEGTIASGASTPFRDFVACTRQEFRGWKEDGARRKEQWTTLEVVRQPLPILTGSGVVRIVNADYELRDEPHTWQSTEGLAYSLLGERTQRVSGFRRGDGVSVEGVVDRTAEDRGVRASVVVGRDRAGYVASLESGAATLRIVGLIFSGVGGLLVCGAAGVALKARAVARRSVDRPGGVRDLVAAVLEVHLRKP